MLSSALLFSVLFNPNLRHLDTMENILPFMISASIYPSIHPSLTSSHSPPTPHTQSGFLYHPGPTAVRLLAFSASAEMNYIAFHTCFCSKPFCRLLCWKKKKRKNISKGGNSAPPARLHLRTRAVKLDSNCINGGLCLPVGFFIFSLSLCAFYTF